MRSRTISPADAAGAGLPGDDFSVAGVDGEDEADDLAIPATDFQAVGRPALDWTPGQ